ncbi:MAG: site-2 protease family protein [Archangiaceae bacterium]|nr:site-2 protease family protein [Archangiaceae bacterium]
MSTPRPRPSFALSFRVARVAGIDVRVHFTMLLLVAWLLIEHLRTGGWGVFSEGVALVVCTFVAVLLHELGHALMARRFGIRTRDITLLPIGGVSTFERPPQRPREELAVAFAGPAVNVALAALLFGTLMAGELVFDFGGLRVAGGPFLAKLLLINLSLAAFNLLPAFPMDGGRALRALLATRLEPEAATRIAAHVGRVLAIGLAVAGVFFSPTLVLVGVFVWFGAQAELSAAKASARLTGLKVADAMVAQFRTLDADTPVSEALELSAGGAQHDFPVRSGSEVLGVLTREGLLAAIEAEGQNAPVGGALSGPLTTLEPGTPLSDAVSVMRANGARAALVFDHGELAGLLTSESVADRLAAAHR